MHRHVPLSAQPGRIFTLQETQLKIVRERARIRGWQLDEKQFEKAAQFPDWPKKAQCALVLDVSLGSVQDTFEEAASYAILPPDPCMWNGHFAQSKIHLADGIPFEPWTLRWQEIDISSPRNTDPRSIADPALMPHSAALWACSYFRKWTRRMGNTIRSDQMPFIWILGYRLAGGRIPLLSWNEQKRRLCFDYEVGEPNKRASVPILVKQ